jgi:hypothetical protein
LSTSFASRSPSCTAIVPVANTRFAPFAPRSQRTVSMSWTLMSSRMPPDVGAKRTKKPLGSFLSAVCERARNGRPIAPVRILS